MKTDPGSMLGRSAIQRVLADRDLMLRRAEERVRTAEARTAELAERLRRLEAGATVDGSWGSSEADTPRGNESAPDQALETLERARARIRELSNGSEGAVSPILDPLPSSESAADGEWERRSDIEHAYHVARDLTARAEQRARVLDQWQTEARATLEEANTAIASARARIEDLAQRLEGEAAVVAGILESLDPLLEGPPAHGGAHVDGSHVGTVVPRASGAHHGGIDG